MNKFSMFDGAIEKLELGDIVWWSSDGIISKEYMIIKNSNSKIELLDTKTMIATPRNFEKLEELKDFLIQKRVDDNEIMVMKLDEWTIYVP